MSEKVEASEFLEREAGSRFHLAVTVCEAQVAAEALYEELRYHDDTPRDLLDALAVVKDAEVEV